MRRWVYLVTILDTLGLVLLVTGHYGWAVLVFAPACAIGAVGIMTRRQ